MTKAVEARWKSMRTKESRLVEKVLRESFPQTDAYRYNPASVRVRVIDSRFEGKTIEERDGMVEPLLKKLPKEIQADIMNLLTLTPSETTDSLRKQADNLEFEDPSPSEL